MVARARPFFLPSLCASNECETSMMDLIIHGHVFSLQLAPGHHRAPAAESQGEPTPC